MLLICFVAYTQGDQLLSNHEKRTKKDIQISENQLKMLKAPAKEVSKLEMPTEKSKLVAPIEMKKLEKPMEKPKLEMKENIPLKKRKRIKK
jgi:hypothetical protein